MSLKCIDTADDIWDSVRDGTQLSSETLRHISSCPSCAKALADAQRCVGAMSKAKPYPAAPDCRGVVMARIAPRATRKPVWVYVCATLAAVTVVGGAVYYTGGVRPSPERRTNLAMDADPQPRHEPLVQPTRQLPETQVQAPQPARELIATRRTHAGRYQAAKIHRRQKSLEPQAAIYQPESPPGSVEPIAEPSEESTALAYVTWRVQAQQSDSYHYSYSSTDPTTGEVTNCSVSREGGVVEINLESEPAKPAEKPVKESKINEAVRCG